MRLAMALVLLGTGFWALAQYPSYFWGSWRIAEEAWAALPARAEALGIPIARLSPETCDLVFTGVEDEEALLSQNAFLYLDGEFFLLGIREGEWTTILRGNTEAAEIVLFGPGAPEALSSLAILEALGLTPPEGIVELSEKEIPVKIPAPPEGMKLDPILWALVGHPDWFQFAQEQGVERVGIRVRVVAELSEGLSAEWEPFIRSSTEKLAELLLPIPLLPKLGRDPAVSLVRPPHTPIPLGG